MTVFIMNEHLNFDYDKAKTENVKINQDPIYEGEVTFCLHVSLQ